MRITRFLHGVLIAVATAGPAAAQYGSGAPASGRYADLVPSVVPVGYADSTIQAGPRMPTGRPAAAANTTALDRVTAPVRQAGGDDSDPVGTLTGQPLVAVPELPYGAYPSPYFTDGPGCCGPLGRNGRVGYELYAYVGPTWKIGEGKLIDHIGTGTMVGGGGRSLFFDTTHTAAWVIDLGLSYQFNHGHTEEPVQVLLHQPPVVVNPFTGQTRGQPDIISGARIRGIDRTNFNFGIGRDWWLWGAGSTGLEDGLNWRVGALVGGRWGTAHVDYVPVNIAALGDYQRHQNVTHGVFLAFHSTVEVPLGTTIFFAGVRAELGYDWTNLIPPLEGNIQEINLMLTAGIRF
jgi:hypothetical protein